MQFTPVYCICTVVGGEIYSGQKKGIFRLGNVQHQESSSDKGIGEQGFSLSVLLESVSHGPMSGCLAVGEQVVIVYDEVPAVAAPRTLTLTRLTPSVHIYLDAIALFVSAWCQKG